jgi:membrane protein
MQSMRQDTQDATGRRSLAGDVGALATYGLLTLLVGRDARPSAPPEFAQPTSRQEPLAVQRLRATEPGRGRDADSPTRIPWRGWKDVLWRTYAQIQKDRLLAISAGVVFFGLLALFPAITALVSLYGLFTKAATIGDHIAFLSQVMPGPVMNVIADQIGRVVAKGDFKLSIGFAVGLAIAVWSANAGMKAMIDALNIVYEEEEKRGFFKLNLVSLAFTLGAVVCLLLAIGAVVALPLLLDQLGLEHVTNRLVQVGRWPLLMLGILAALAILFRHGPSRREPKWRWVTVGSGLATVFWTAGSLGFSYYLGKYAHYDVTYGSLGTAIGLMMWMWMTAIVILFGAELNSEIEHQTAIDSTDGRPKPLGTRGATMADTVGAAQA